MLQKTTIMELKRRDRANERTISKLRAEIAEQNLQIGSQGVVLFYRHVRENPTALHCYQTQEIHKKKQQKLKQEGYGSTNQCYDQ